MKGISAVAIVMLGTAGTMELSAQAFAQAEPQPALLPQQATVQPTHRAQVLDALGKGDFASAEKFISDLQGQLQANSALATQSGSTVFEELKACGFYPQETRLACMIEIKQQLGYAGPVGAPGSMEHVYFCIDWDNNGLFTQLESAGQGTVQMHDEAHPTQAKPPWVYAIYRDFNPFGGSRTSTAERRHQQFRVRLLLGSRPLSRGPLRRPAATIFQFGATAWCFRFAWIRFAEGWP